MFTRLLEKKMWPLKNEDMIDLMFFEDNIRLKVNRYMKNIKRKHKTAFLDDANSHKQPVDYNCDILKKLVKPLSLVNLKEMNKSLGIIPF